MKTTNPTAAHTQDYSIVEFTAQSGPYLVRNYPQLSGNLIVAKFDSAVSDELAQSVLTALNGHAELLAALEACLDSMTRQFPNGLPIQQGTHCEEQDWDNALNRAKTAILSAKGGSL